MQHSDEHPPHEIRRVKGEWWVKMPTDDETVFLGIAPRPRNQFEALIHHVCHGLLMRYPIRDVLIWSWQNRDTFLKD